MLTENTVTKLQEMHLSAMAKAFKDQMTDPNMADMSFEDRFGLLVDHEWTTRKNNHLKRLIKNAGFAESGACVEDIEYHADRNLDKAQIARLAIHRRPPQRYASWRNWKWKDIFGLRSRHGGGEKILHREIRALAGASHRTRHCP